MFAHIAVMLMSLEFMPGTAGADGVGMRDGRGRAGIETGSGMLGIVADMTKMVEQSQFCLSHSMRVWYSLETEIWKWKDAMLSPCSGLSIVRMLGDAFR